MTPKPPGSTVRNGYDQAHRALRKQWQPIVEAGRAICWRCRNKIHPAANWHLGHDDDRRYYRGPEHAKCSSGSKPAEHPPAQALNFFQPS
jgi:hypothetical protein